MKDFYVDGASAAVLYFSRLAMLHCESLTLDHGQRHVSFSKAAHSWSYKTYEYFTCNCVSFV